MGACLRFVYGGGWGKKFYSVYVERRFKLPNGGWCVVVKDRETKRQHLSINSKAFNGTLTAAVEKANDRAKALNAEITDAEA